MRKNFTSNQYYACVVLVFSLALVGIGRAIPEGFYADPVGPRVWVQGIGLCLAALSLLLFFTPSSFRGNLPTRAQWLQRLPFTIAVVGYAYALPAAGFALSTTLLMFVVGLLFGASWQRAVVSGGAMTLGCYLVFDFALGISLPTGLWWK